MKNKAITVGPFLYQNLPCLPNYSCALASETLEQQSLRASARKQIERDVLQFLLAKQIGSKCHMVMWIEHNVFRKKVVSTNYEAIITLTAGAGGGGLGSYWNCWEAAQVDSVLRWICNFPKRQISSHCKDKGVFLLPNTPSDTFVGLVFLPRLKNKIVT